MAGRKDETWTGDSALEKFNFKLVTQWHGHGLWQSQKFGIMMIMMQTASSESESETPPLGVRGTLRAAVNQDAEAFRCAGGTQWTIVKYWSWSFLVTCFQSPTWQHTHWGSIMTFWRTQTQWSWHTPAVSALDSATLNNPFPNSIKWYFWVNGKSSN